MFDERYRTALVVSNRLPIDVYGNYPLLIKEFLELIVAEKLPFHDFPKTPFTVHPERVCKAAGIVMYFFFGDIA
jgi:hypothetical protein